MQRIRPLTAALLGLSVATVVACAHLSSPPVDPNLLSSLRANAAAGQTGSVDGYVVLFNAGVPTPLYDWPVTLLPSSPRLEAAIAAFAERYRKAGPAPLAPEERDQAERLLRQAHQQMGQAGYSNLIRTVRTTGAEPQFTFPDVPAGRWLLVAEISTRQSRLLWAVPITVQPGQSLHQSLTDRTLWLEGLLPTP